MKKPRQTWLWIGAAVALSGALAAMYVYEKSLQEDLELMLRSALQQFRAGRGDAEAQEPEEEDPAAREAAAAVSDGMPSPKDPPAE